MKSDPNFSAATSCSELEKLVGRRKNPGMSLAEQQERFPFLKDAPVEHAYAAGVKVRVLAPAVTMTQPIPARLGNPERCPGCPLVTTAVGNVAV